MKKFIYSISILLCFISSFAEEKPNILIIMADDLGFADLGYQGSKDVKSPHIDKLANNAIRFTNGYVSASVCSPSRAGMMTGRYQQRFGHEANIPPKKLGMALNEKTIADRLKACGYRTGIIGKWHLGNSQAYYPTSRGFDYFCGLREGSRGYFYDAKKSDKPGNAHAIEENGKQIKFDKYLTDFLGDKAIEFIKKDKSKPFFLFLSFTAPHAPMHATKEDLELFKHIENKKRRIYAAMIWAMDRAIGKVIKHLKDNNMEKNTIVWFLSDNGGATVNASSNLPLAGHKGIKFEGGIRVPFFMKWPAKFPKGGVYKKMVSSLDLLPTSVKVAGGVNTPEQKLDGVDILPYVEGAKEGAPHGNLYWHKLWFSAMRKGPWKIIYVQDYGYALYNLDDDMRELNNLAKSQPKRLDEMKAELNAWKGELAKPLWLEGKNWFKVHSKNHIRIIEGTDKRK